MDKGSSNLRDLVCFGDINVDSTPIFRQGFSKQRNYEMNLGGTASNVAVAAARLGSDAQFVGKVGNDTFRQDVLNLQLSRSRLAARPALFCHQTAPPSCCAWPHSSGQPRPTAGCASRRVGLGLRPMRCAVAPV